MAAMGIISGTGHFVWVVDGAEGDEPLDRLRAGQFVHTHLDLHWR